MNIHNLLYSTWALTTLAFRIDSWAAQPASNVRFERTYGAAVGGAYAWSIVPTSDGGFLVGGESAGPPGGTRTARWFGGQDYWIVKCDADEQPTPGPGPAGRGARPAFVPGLAGTLAVAAPHCRRERSERCRSSTAMLPPKSARIFARTFTDETSG